MDLWGAINDEPIDRDMIGRTFRNKLNILAPSYIQVKVFAPCLEPELNFPHFRVAAEQRPLGFTQMRRCLYHVNIFDTGSRGLEIAYRLKLVRPEPYQKLSNSLKRGLSIPSIHLPSTFPSQGRLQ